MIGLKKAIELVPGSSCSECVFHDVDCFLILCQGFECTEGLVFNIVEIKDGDYNSNRRESRSSGSRLPQASKE